jgi:ABC-type multidrug transport system fused ATPase/permease subunit
MGLLDVGFGDLLWSLIVIFFMVIYFMILFQVIVDIFRRKASGWNKALWLLFLLIVPIVALIAYMITNSEGMAERRMGDIQDAQQRQADYIRGVAGGSGGPTQEIAHAKELLDSGAISQAEFDQLKAKALAG